ncbi:type II toxin-antitoxin system YafO family toxin [Aliamphritea hakodatensis]|uniref:type II toxin-antitoxin system YafO family toxin n=1 Tax=Aliamphritea hakodatensis TaxID=2895352 RepID=UPI0022FD9BE8|nr:type II toxin-antitoxin system YafO family toxin [Aliamphritea hakodatensis]
MRIFKGRVLRAQLTEQEQIALTNDFRRYKTTGELPDTFGRDAAYDHPNTPPLIQAGQVQHIHLLDESDQWDVHTIQFYRTSDKHLVYCPGALHDDCFLLMAILSPDAHAQAKDSNIMRKLGLMAEKFRNIY